MDDIDSKVDLTTLQPSSRRLIEAYQAQLRKTKRKPREKMRSFGHLSQEILERIAELVNAQATTSRDLANLALIHPNITAIAKRYMYKHIRIVKEAHWLDPDPLIERFKKLGAYSTVESFVLACPSIISDVDNTALQMKHAIKVAQECKAPSLTLSGDGFFLGHLSLQEFHGLTSLTLHHYGQIHWRYEHLVRIINCNAASLKQLTIGAHDDGQLVGSLFHLEPLPALESFTFIHSESNEEPFGPIAFLTELVQATQNGANLKYLAVETAHTTILQLSHLFGDLLAGVEHVRLVTVWDTALPRKNSIFLPMAQYLNSDNCPNLRRLEISIKQPEELEFFPSTTQLEELGILMHGGPDHFYTKKLRAAVESCIETLQRVRIYDVWRFPGCVKMLRGLCEPRGIHLSPLSVQEFKVHDGRGTATEDFVDGKYMNHRKQEAYIWRKQMSEPIIREPEGLEKLLAEWRKSAYDGRDRLICGF